MRFEEQETTVNVSSADSVARIWTTRPSDIRAMRRRRDQFTEVDSGFYDETSEWAQFELPRHRFSVAAGAKRVMSDAQRDKARAVARRNFGQVN